MRILPFVLLSVFLSGCGLLYTNVKLPRAYRTAVPSEVKASPDDPVVQGRACLQSVLFLFAWGDGGYEAAAKDALKAYPDRMLYDVKTDVQARTILVGVYARNCTYLTGRAAKP